MSTENQNHEVAYQQQNEMPATVSPDIIESLVLNGDLSKMSGQQKVQYYNQFCKSLGLNPLTQPFEIINLKGKLRMYAKKDATDQLRNIYGVSVTKLEKEQIGDIYMVTATGQNKHGRVDSSIGALTIANLQGENLANAIMKCETKAKRRLTLSLCGLGMLDETEVESAQTVQAEAREAAQTVNIDTLDPADPATKQKFEEMMQAVAHDLVPAEAFGPGTDKNKFIAEFRTSFESGTMPNEYGNKIYNYVLTFFQQAQPQ